MEGEQPMSTLPERVNVMRVISYDVARIVEQIHADRDSEVIYDQDGSRRLSADEPITLADVMDKIENYCYDDFAGEIYLRDLIFQDENGNEITDYEEEE
jgi:hypothetical protein